MRVNQGNNKPLMKPHFHEMYSYTYLDSGVDNGGGMVEILEMEYRGWGGEEELS